jgi:membrane-associated phospholipid phosphatase
MLKIQKIISAFLHPFTLPLFGTVLLMELGIFGDLPLAYRLYIDAIVLVNMCILPALGIWLLLKTGLVSDLDVSERSDRIWPYLIVLVTGITGCVMLFRAQLPWWTIKFYLGSAIGTFIAFLITLKWKISAHTLASGCLIASALIISFQVAQSSILILSIMFILTGLQASSRIYLKAHTLGQVFAGFLLGFITVSCSYFFIP